MASWDDRSAGVIGAGPDIELYCCKVADSNWDGAFSSTIVGCLDWAIDNGMNVQMTTDAARFTHSQNSNVLSLENDLYSLVGRSLEARGHSPIARSLDCRYPEPDP